MEVSIFWIILLPFLKGLIFKREIMENRLDVLTKKLYEEGVERARAEAERVVAEARAEAERVVKEAREEAARVVEEARKEGEGLRRKADSEMRLAAGQAVAALKQSITGLVSGRVAGEMARTAYEDKELVRELLLEVARRWDAGEGALDLEMVVPEGEREALERFVAGRCRELLDRGLTIRVAGETRSGYGSVGGDGGEGGDGKDGGDGGVGRRRDGEEEGFVIRPREGGYEVGFSERLFEEFFARYTRGLTRELLFKK